MIGSTHISWLGSRKSNAPSPEAPRGNHGRIAKGFGRDPGRAREGQEDGVGCGAASISGLSCLCKPYYCSDVAVVLCQLRHISPSVSTQYRNECNVHDTVLDVGWDELDQPDETTASLSFLVYYTAHSSTEGVETVPSTLKLEG